MWESSLDPDTFPPGDFLWLSLWQELQQLRGSGKINQGKGTLPVLHRDRICNPSLDHGFNPAGCPSWSSLSLKIIKNKYKWKCWTAGIQILNKTPPKWLLGSPQTPD